MQRLRNVKLIYDECPQWIVITDSEKALLDARASKRAVIGICHSQGKYEDLLKADYLVEDISVIDDKFAKRVCQRYLALPWTISQEGGLLLREMTLDDVPKLYNLYGELEENYVEPLNPNLEIEIEIFKAYEKNMYKFFEYGIWALIETQTNCLIGRVGFSNWEYKGENVIELVYQIAPKFRRQGYAIKAVEMALKYGREELEFSQIYCRISSKNTPSICLANKLGFQYLEQIEEGNKEILLYSLTLLC